MVWFLRFRREVDLGRWRWTIAFVLVVSACGGGDSGGDTATTGVSEDTPATEASPVGVSVTSSDGIVTVEVPAGAAPEGVTVTVDAGDPGSLPQQLLDTGLPVFVYELGPDGTQFSEPVTVTFRIPAALAEFDPAVGMPLAVLASRSGDGLLDLYGSVDISLDGDVLVVSGSTDHFTEAVVILDGVELSLVTLPSPVKVGKGQIFHALVSNILDYQKAFEATGIDNFVEVLYKSEAPITTLSPVIDGIDERLAAAGGVGQFRCDGETGGVQPDAITAEIETSYDELVIRDGERPVDPNFDFATLFTFLNLFGYAADAEVVATFHADVECTEDEESGTEEPPVTGSGNDPEGDQEKDSEKVKPGEGEGGGDMKNVRSERGPSGETCTIIDFYGDGETLAAEVGTYRVDIEAADSAGGGFGVSARFRNGTPEPGGVFLGPNGPGRDRLEGAIVTLVWEAGDTLRVCVDSGETDLPAVATFQVSIGVFTTDGTFWDQATGVGAS